MDIPDYIHAWPTYTGFYYGSDVVEFLAESFHKDKRQVIRYYQEARSPGVVYLHDIGETEWKLLSWSEYGGADQWYKDRKVELPSEKIRSVVVKGKPLMVRNRFFALLLGYNVAKDDCCAIQFAMNVKGRRIGFYLWPRKPFFEIFNLNLVGV